MIFYVIAQKHSKIRLLKNIAFFVVVVVGVVCLERINILEKNSYIILLLLLLLLLYIL